MGLYVIAIGGTGNKLLESMVYAACADAFYKQEANGGKIPFSCIHMLSVDVDAACGNTTRAKRAAQYYESIRSAFESCPYRHPCFHTQISLDQWSVDLSRRASSVAQMARNHSDDRLLSRALFSKTEAELEYSEGFRGHPDLGVLFFSDLLSSLDQARKQGQPDELNHIIDLMEDDIMAGETAQVLLCGSIFGGTGASGIPALSHYLSDKMAGHKEQFVMGAVLMLPYYSVPKTDVDTNKEIAVESDTFLDKARTALQYYGMEHMIRDSETDEQGVFDAVYLLGLPPEHFVCTKMYSTGSQSQENDAHMLEWIAARCAARFLRTSFRNSGAHNIDCYYYQWHTPAFSWESFDEDAQLYRCSYGALLKTAAVFFSELYPTLSQYFTGKKNSAAKVGYCAAYFHAVKTYTQSQREHVNTKLEDLFHFLAFFIRWFRQIVQTLPEGFKNAKGINALVDEKLLGMLSDLIDDLEEGTPPDLSDCQMLQKQLHRLVLHTVPDKHHIGHVIRALGGSDAPLSAPDSAFTAFLSVLLSSVIEKN